MSHYICKGRMPLMVIFVINFGAGILKVPYTSIVTPSVICGKTLSTEIKVFLQN